MTRPVRAYEAFAEETMYPVASEVGVDETPEIRFFEVDNSLAGGRRNG
jgi:hypothetical protein